MAREGQDEVRITQGGLSTLVDQVGRSSRIIFVSSDAVLPGSSGHYREDTPPVASRGVTALDHYINAKIAAERLIAEASSNFCIVRPGPIFGTRVTGGWDGRTHRMLEALGRGAGLQQPWNLVRTYSHVQDLADSLCELSQSQVNGVLHVGAPLPTSHFDFGKVLAHRAGYRSNRCAVLRYHRKTPRSGILDWIHPWTRIGPLNACTRHLAVCKKRCRGNPSF